MVECSNWVFPTGTNFHLDDDNLDTAVRDIKMNHPNCGEVMIIGHLGARRMIGGAAEFAIEFILCDAQLTTNSFVGTLSHMLAWMGLAALL